jgi:hypothetical protein
VKIFTTQKKKTCFLPKKEVFKNRKKVEKVLFFEKLKVTVESGKKAFSLKTI